MQKDTVQLIYPHQLFRTETLDKRLPVYIVEEHLFFRQFKFHQHKLAYHMASMLSYFEELKGKGFKVRYIKSVSEEADSTILFEKLKDQGVKKIQIFPLTDDLLERKLSQSGLEITELDNPQFLLSSTDLGIFFQKERKRYLHAQFYKKIRKRENILMDHGDPEGGKWSFDQENRKTYKKGDQIPSLNFPHLGVHWHDAFKRVEAEYSKNPGRLNNLVNYPINHAEAQDWFEQFLEIRFHQFGKYEDAILKNGVFNHHSVLSLLMNNGLLEPREVVGKSIRFAEENDVPLNSVEGFVRQIIGWREFIRGIYMIHGRKQRTTNYLNLENKLPETFYKGSTGIDPIDDTIKKVLDNSYCHHIERLMVLGNFMLLCEIHPDEVYRWFMELFVDAFDWVMVPNVYGMSQFSDGGLFATKPYISSSNYIIKMSDYKQGEWSDIWDALYWRFVDKHSCLFEKNPRSKLILNNWYKKSEEARIYLIEKAENWLKAEIH